MLRLFLILPLLLLTVYWWPHAKLTTNTYSTEAGTITVSRDHRFWGRNLALGPNFWELKLSQATVKINKITPPLSLLWSSKGDRYAERAIAFYDGEVFLAFDRGADIQVSDCFRYKVFTFVREGWVDARPLLDVSLLDWVAFSNTREPATPFPLTPQDNSRLLEPPLSNPAHGRRFDINEKLLFCKTK